MSATREIRLQFGITQQHLANFLDVSNATISMADANRRDLPYEALKKLTNFFVLLPIKTFTQISAASKDQAEHQQIFTKKLTKQIDTIKYKIHGQNIKLDALKAFYSTAVQKLQLVNMPEAKAMIGKDALLISLWEDDAVAAIKKSHMGIQALLQIEIDTLQFQLSALIKLQGEESQVL